MVIISLAEMASMSIRYSSLDVLSSHTEAGHQLPVDNITGSPSLLHRSIRNS